MYSTLIQYPCEVDFEITAISSGTSNDSGYISLWQTTSTSTASQQRYNQYYSSSNLKISKDNVLNNTVAVSSKTGVYKLKIYSDKIETYKDGTLLNTMTYSNASGYLSFTGGNANRYLTIKDLKIKPL